MEQPRVLEDHAERRAQLVARHLAALDAVDADPALIDLVEPHEQVDQRGLAGAGRSDDGDRLAGFDDEVEVLDERDVGQVAERDVLELDPPGDRAADRRRSATSGISSSSSSSSKTRSAEAIADWMTLAMLAVWVIGIVNWREYWTNAWTSPRLIWPLATWMPPMTQIST